MKKTGDYYVIVVEDTNLAQIVATATLITEHKYIHACAKVNPTQWRKSKIISVSIFRMHQAMIIIYLHSEDHVMWSEKTDLYISTFLHLP